MSPSSRGIPSSSTVALRHGLAALLLFAAGCGKDPEQLLVGRWQQVVWRYERPERTKSPWIDELPFPELDELEEEGMRRHEAEYWEFLPGHRLRIVGRGQTIQAGWRIKGRGHVLKIEYGNALSELYDIKELDEKQMILHFDIGMEVRGIAKLEFRRTDANPSSSGEGRAGR